MTNDNLFFDTQRNGGNSLSLDIRNTSANTNFNSNGTTSMSTTMNTTAATNTPATNVNSLSSPDFNSYSQFSFDSPEFATPSVNFKFGNGPAVTAPTPSSQQQQEQQQQQQRPSKVLDNTQMLAASSATKSTNSLNEASNNRNYDYYKIGNRNNSNSNSNRVMHSHTLSTPTAMNDFIAMLDAQSAIQQQKQQDERITAGSHYESNSNSDLSSNGFPVATKNEDADSLSPLPNHSAQFIDPNLLKSNLFIDTFGLSQSGEDTSASRINTSTNTVAGSDELYQQSSLNSLLDDYVSTELLINDTASSSKNNKMAHMHSSQEQNYFSNDRRHSDVITSAVPEVSDSRGSISHSVDFWNLPDRRNTVTGTFADKKPNNLAENSASTFNMDNELTQVLNDYNMNFTKPLRRESHGGTPTFVSNSNAQQSAQRHGVKKQQRSSMSLLDGSLNNDLFSKLYKNGNPSSNLKVVSWENAVLSDDDDEFGLRNIDASMPCLEPIVSPKSPKSVGGSTSSVTKPKNQKFIKPSMMLSENASTAAKVATTGAEKMDLISGLDRRNYDISSNPSLKIRKSPPPHYHTLKPSPVTSMNPIMSAPAAQRRRRSTPNLMTIHNNGNIGAMNAIVNNSANRSKSRSITPMSGADDEAKPFKCKECSKAFRRSEHLKRHIRSVHSTERPFACMFCEKKFSRSDNLSQHLKTHKKHGDF